MRKLLSEVVSDRSSFKFPRPTLDELFEQIEAGFDNCNPRQNGIVLLSLVEISGSKLLSAAVK